MYAGDSGIDPQQHLFSQLCDHVQARENNWADGNVARSCNLEYDEAYARFAAAGIGPQRTGTDQAPERLARPELL